MPEDSSAIAAASTFTARTLRFASDAFDSRFNHEMRGEAIESFH